MARKTIDEKIAEAKKKNNESLEKICLALDCRIEDVVEVVENNKRE